MKQLRLLLIVATAAFISPQMLPARAADIDAPTLIVAAPKLTGPYEQTVLISVPAGDGTHIGFILNRPTQANLAALLPDYAPAKQVTAPVFIGGPELNGSLFALVRSPRAPAAGSLELLPGLFMAYRESDMDRVIGSHSADARFFVGIVAWDVGELEAELRAGAWHALAPDMGFVMDSSVDNLWSRLIAQIRAI